MDGRDPYRIRDFVPGFDAISAEIAARSRSLTARATVRADLAYGEGPRETLDLILPPAPTAGAPLHVFVHGGYWRSGEKEAYRCVAAPVLAAGGIAAVVEYDLMPGTRLAILVGQVRRAVHWLQRHAAGIGADPDRITVSGHSAGAHLASYLAAAGPQETPPDLPRLRGLLLVSGIYDLSGIPASFLKDEARMTPEEAAAWSPVTSRQMSSPPRTFIVGGEETQPFHDQAGRLHRLLRAQGSESELRTEPNLNHMNVVLDLADPKQPLGRHLADLVEGS
ncbi:alpha/beta hydrolase [Rubellimicrobium arenae]|uniref:alpha/beta hydrolase n=1 Tax=Rubellimicrobium arenae TaxID=2817372 RepID=UPI001B306E04|nr:alpha/beta hydrolase [Rubellimicrobium arenae]